MTKIFTMTINGHNYEVFGQYWETRNSWGHTGYLLKDGEEVSRERIRYYNRTWEAYRFQSAGAGAVENARKLEEARALDNYRAKVGRTRLTADMKAEAIRESEPCQIYATILKGLHEQRRYY